MPTYEYECSSCGVDFDVFQSMSDDPLKVCPTCGNSVRRKIGGGTGIIFKGSGFYKNDSRKTSSSGGGTSSASGSKPADGGGKGERGATEPQAEAPKADASKPGAGSSPAASSSESPKKEAS